MSMRGRFGALVVILAVAMTGDLFACGDKFLVGGRGTRYQRPRNARAASVLGSGAAGARLFVKVAPGAVVGRAAIVHARAGALTERCDATGVRGPRDSS